jgi:hypothetical protein
VFGEEVSLPLTNKQKKPWIFYEMRKSQEMAALFDPVIGYPKEMGRKMAYGIC